MKIAFISLYDKIALGLRSLSAYLKAHGHKTSIIYFKNYRQVRLNQVNGPVDADLHIQIKEDGRYALGYPESPTEEEWRLLIKLFKELRPDLVGVSLTYLHRNIAIKLSKEIKKNYPVPIIWGGVSPTIEPQFALEYADMVLRGEGEEAMLELADRLDRKEDISNIQNIWFRYNHKIIQNPLRPLIKDLDILPFIDTSPQNKYSIDGNRLYKNERSLSNDLSQEKYEIMTNRGCPYRCTYCVNHQLRKLYKDDLYLRQRSVSHVIRELVEVKETQPIKFIEFQDDIFPWHREWVNEFRNLYKEKVGIPFCCYLHPNHMDSFVLRALKDSGIHHAVIGIQSGSKNILYNVFHRPTPVRRILDAAKKLKQENIFTCFDVLTENLFETETDRRATLSLLLKIPTPFSINLSRLSIFPGTEINELAEKEKTNRCMEKNTSRFWSALYLLSVERYLPRSIIFLFSRLTFLKYNPQYLEFILKLYIRIKAIKKRTVFV